MRMREPFLAAEGAARRKTGLCQRCFQFLRIPLRDLASKGFLVVATIKEIQVPLEQLHVGWSGLKHHVAIIAAEKHVVDFDMLRVDKDRSSLLLDEMRRMQIVQCVDDVNCDVGLLTCARMPDGGACDSEEQLSRSRCFAKSVRRTDHRIATVQHRIALEMWGKAEVINEGGKWLKRSRGEALHMGCSHLDPVVARSAITLVVIICFLDYVEEYVNPQEKSMWRQFVCREGL